MAFLVFLGMVIRSISFAWKLQVAFWAVLFTSVLYLSDAVLGFPDSLYRTVLIFLCHLVNFYSFYSLIVPGYFEKKKVAQAIVAGAVVIAVLTPLRYMIDNTFAYALADLATKFKLAGTVAFIVFTEVAIAGFASLIRLVVSNEETKQRLAVSEKNRMEAELKFLKAQVHPHFLFNSINNIYGLALTKSERTPEALMKLSALLRYLLYESNGPVAVAKEIDAARAYVELFQLRFEQPLNMRIESAVNDPMLKVEPFIILPLVENAIKHSGLGISGDAFGKFVVERSDHGVSIRTENSRHAAHAALEKGGIGLTNIRRRLDMLYPGNYKLEVNETPEKFSVTLQLPSL